MCAAFDLPPLVLLSSLSDDCCGVVTAASDCKVATEACFMLFGALRLKSVGSSVDFRLSAREERKDRHGGRFARTKNVYALSARYSK